MLSSDQIEELKNIRREIHSTPEPSGEEVKTSEFIKSELQKTNPDEIIDGIGGHGLVAIYKGVNPDEGKSLMFRSELDGLKVNEENEFDYKSVTRNRMHACGHDGHMTIVLGVAKYLKENRPAKGSVILLFQPAEETGEGAGRMLEDPAFKELTIDRGFALHNLPGFKENHVYIKDETFACASVGLEIVFKGKSSHAAHPEEGINPAHSVAELITLLEAVDQKSRSRELYNIFTITYVHMGEEAYGISPGQARIGITMRAETDDLLKTLKTDIVDEIEKAGKSFKGSISYKEREPFAATVNDSNGVESVLQAARNADIPVEKLDTPMYWSEDFGGFRQKCPITLMGLGAGKDSFPLHSEKYDFNDNLILTGVSLFVTLIKQYSHE